MSTKPYYLPYIVVPPFTACEKTYVIFGQGTPPYSIYIIGPDSSAPLEYLPVQANPGVFGWTVDFQPGANITFALIDSKGEAAYSGSRVVQQNGGTTCPKNSYSSKSATNVGAIVGGVLGGLAIILLVLGVFFYHRRRVSSNRKRSLSAGYGEQDDSETRQVPSGVGVRRAGTFNLHNIRFNEATMDQLREEDTPPQYVPKPSEDAVHAGSRLGPAASIATLSDDTHHEHEPTTPTSSRSGHRH